MQLRPILLAFFSLAPLCAYTQSILVTPASVEPGSPVFIRVEDPKATSLSGEWLGHKIQFFHPVIAGHTNQPWYALAGADVEAPVGTSTLHVTTNTASSSHTVEVTPAHYRTGTLSVAPKFVEPDAEALKLIASERELKDRTFASSAATPLWSGNFHAPVAAPPTDSFGTRRTFNGKLASIHKGMDFRVPTGTPIYAANAGIVVLAQPLVPSQNSIWTKSCLCFQLQARSEKEFCQANRSLDRYVSF